MVRVYRGANRSRQEVLPVADDDGRLKDLRHALTNTLQLVIVLEFDDDREFITGEPCNHVALAQNALNTLGSLLQNLIAAFVAVQIVNRLEKIKVHVQHGETTAVALPLGHPGLEEFLEQR